MRPYGDYGDRPATEAEAHAEWHRNAGVPMDQPGCPWDCCDPPEEHDDGPEAGEMAPVVKPDVDGYSGFYRGGEEVDRDDIPF